MIDKSKDLASIKSSKAENVTFSVSAEKKTFFLHFLRNILRKRGKTMLHTDVEKGDFYAIEI